VLGVLNAKDEKCVQVAVDGLLSHAFGTHLLLNGIIADLVEFQSSHIIKCWITPTIVAYCG
jgi:hypothetical protein